MKIRTSFDYPPIPIRSFDWSAIDDDTYDGAPDSSTRNQVGHGATEQEAIADLMEQVSMAAELPITNHPKFTQGTDSAVSGEKHDF